MTTIIAADLVAYSRLVAGDEEGVIARLRAVWNDVVSPTVQNAGGRVVKTMGDGFLAEFKSPVEALRCALAIQEAMSKREIHLDDQERLRFRLGLHIGDIVSLDGDIFGDAVNVAARLEGLSPVGGVCMSGITREQVKNKVTAPLRSIGEVQIKNIPSPIKAWIIGDGEREVVETADSAPKIVVLPFEDMGAEDSFFADGVVEEITSALSTASDLSVISRQSAFSFKGRGADIREIGRALGARYVVSGAVRRAQTRVRISVQLSSVTTGINLWAQRYDDDLDDLFALQDRIASHVAGAVSPSVRASEIAEARAIPPMERRAYELYLSAFPHFWKHRAEENERAIELLTTALDRDRRNTRPQAIRAWAYAQQATYMWTKEPLQSRQKALEDAEAAALTAEDHAPSLVAIAAALGMTGMEHERAERMLDRALTLDPNSAWGWMRLGWNHVYQENVQAGLEAFNRAEALSPRDPFFFNFQFGRAYAYGLDGNFDEAIRLVELGLTAGAGVTWAYRDLASYCAQAGREAEADKALEALLHAYPGLVIQRVVDSMPPATQARHKQFIDGLRHAGVPEH